MHIDVAIDHLKGLITYLKYYRENGFALPLESTKKNDYRNGYRVKILCKT